MECFTTFTAIACPLALENIDTDQLIPARFMSRPRTAGYGGFLLHDQRFGPDSATKDFILDHAAFAGAKILVARRNFGTGSSREAAVYALWDFGIRCVIAPSFGDIFASNAVKNGLLPAQVSEPEADQLLTVLGDASAPEITVDLNTGLIARGDWSIKFAIDPVRRLQLLNGWDDLDLTLQHQPAIRNYREKRLRNQAWAFPAIS
jgi:3-isopropylmalate/(R)-2-methylmalate dehydratase small subunit